MKTLIIGVIGTGHMGEYHVNVLISLKNISKIFIFDIDKEKLKEITNKFDVFKTNSLEELLQKVDCCVLAVQTTLHFKIGIQVLKAGKHLLIEKPITNNIEEAKELINVANTKKLVLQVGHVERFNGAVQELQNTIKNPFLWESRRIGPNTYRSNDVGVSMDLLIHDIDIALRSIDDDIISITAASQSFFNTEHEDVISATLRFKKGCIANFIASRVSHQKVRTLHISQKNSYLFLDFTTQDFQIHRQANTNIVTYNEKIRYRQESLIERLFVHKENPLKLELSHFLDSIINKKSTKKTNEIDLKTLTIIKEIQKKCK